MFSSGKQYFITDLVNISFLGYIYTGKEKGHQSCSQKQGPLSQ
jgi:hypothetical protein